MPLFRGAYQSPRLSSRLGLEPVSCLKRCPSCGSISPDSEMVCGACGSSIADVPFETMEEIEREREDYAKRETEEEHREFEKVKVRMVATKIVGGLVTVGVILAGFYLVFDQLNVLGIFVIMVGFAMVAAVLGTGPFTFWWAWWRRFGLPRLYWWLRTRRSGRDSRAD